MRLPNGYGSVHKLSGKRRKPWRVRITLQRCLVDGKAKQIYGNLGYYATQKEALQALADYNENPYDLTVGRLTFKTLYEKWSEKHFPTVSESNVKGYKAAFKLCSDIENMVLTDIKLDHLQQIADKSGKNYPTLRKYKVLLGLMYDYAVIHEYLPPEKRELIKYIDIKSAGNPNAFNRKPFSKKQIKAIWDAKDSNEYVSVVLILIYTGLRIGELLDLKKEDIHLEERWFFVKESKTATGIREVPIAEKIVPLFECWMKKNSDYLICSPSEKHFTYRNYYDSYWVPVMVQLNMGQLVPVEDKKKPTYKGHRPHDARHTCISLLTEVCVDERILQQIVGHKGQNVTRAVYTHIDLPYKLEAINKI